MKRGQAARHAAKPGADGIHRPVRHGGRCRSCDEDDDAARNAAGEPAQEQDDGNGRTAQERGGEGGRTGAGQEQPDARDELAGHFSGLQAEQVPDLRAGDQHADAVGEPDHDGTRNVLDGGPEPGDSEEHEDHAGHACT
jgi:hypothetical protein